MNYHLEQLHVVLYKREESKWDWNKVKSFYLTPVGDLTSELEIRQGDIITHNGKYWVVEDRILMFNDSDKLCKTILRVKPYSRTYNTANTHTAYTAEIPLFPKMVLPDDEF